MPRHSFDSVHGYLVFGTAFVNPNKMGRCNALCNSPFKNFLQYVCGETLKREGQGLLCQLL